MNSQRTIEPIRSKRIEGLCFSGAVTQLSTRQRAISQSIYMTPCRFHVLSQSTPRAGLAGLTCFLNHRHGLIVECRDSLAPKAQVVGKFSLFGPLKAPPATMTTTIQLARHRLLRLRLENSAIISMMSCLSSFSTRLAVQCFLKRTQVRFEKITCLGRENKFFAHSLIRYSRVEPDSVHLSRLQLGGVSCQNRNLSRRRRCIRQRKHR